MSRWSGLKASAPPPKWGKPLRCFEPRLGVKGKRTLQPPLNETPGHDAHSLSCRTTTTRVGCFETLEMVMSAVRPVQPTQSGWTEQSMMRISRVALGSGHLAASQAPAS